MSIFKDQNSQELTFYKHVFLNQKWHAIAKGMYPVLIGKEEDACNASTTLGIKNNCMTAFFI